MPIYLVNKLKNSIQINFETLYYPKYVELLKIILHKNVFRITCITYIVQMPCSYLDLNFKMSTSQEATNHFCKFKIHNDRKMMTLL